MVHKNKALERNLNGISVYQRENDGYVNATQICKAHRQITGEQKEPSEWLSNKSAKSAINKLSSVTGIPVTELVEAKQTGKYRGTWIHPRLAVRFAMWVNDDFSLLVEDWIHKWFESSASLGQLESDIDRVSVRDELKDVKRLALTEQVKFFLEQAGSYNPSSRETQIFFGRVHNEINIVLTSEKAIDMRSRLENQIGKKISEKELLRDYFPIMDLVNYASICQAAANNMESGMNPISAIRLAAKQVLSPSYIPAPIDFTERISLVRRRIEQAQVSQLFIEGSDKSFS
jgi:hypothetical protein